MIIAVQVEDFGNLLFILLQGQVAPEGYKLFWMLGAVVFVLLLLWFIIYRSSKRQSSQRKYLFRKRKLKLDLSKDRSVRPKTLKLIVENIGASEVDMEAPVLLFRKLWSKRKFKLKKVNGKLIYPLFLETGKIHRVDIDLTKFFEHDKKIKRFYWGRIIISDVKGKTFKSKYVSLRKSLFT